LPRKLSDYQDHSPFASKRSEIHFNHSWC